MKFISKLKKAPSILSSKFIFFSCDFETTIINYKHHVIAYSIFSDVLNITQTKSLISFNTGNLIEDSNGLLENFIDTLFQISKTHEKKNTRLIFLFHNCNKFDSIFILNYALKNNFSIDIFRREAILYRLSLTNHENMTITFRDTFLICPLSLSVWTKTLKTNSEKKHFDHNQKLEIPYSKIFFSQLEEYCLNDSILLMSCYTHFRKTIFELFKVDIFDSLTLASLSLRIFRKNYYDIEKYPIQHLMGGKEEFVRESYIGGQVEVYRPSLKNGYCYDVNGLFPFVMSEYDMPVGEGVYVDISEDGFDFENFFGFLRVIVQAPENIYIPILPVRDEKNGVVCPIGTWEGVYFSEELKYAKSLGYCFTFLKGLKFSRGKPFTNFIKEIYQIRLDAKSSGLESIYKKILNSLYGRLGMKNTNGYSGILDDIHPFNIYFDINNITLLDQHKHTPKVILEYSSPSSRDNKDFGLKKNILSQEDLNHPTIKKDVVYDLKTAVQISACTTSYARIVMHKYKNSCNGIYYSDTDSLFTDQPLPSELVSDNTLGKLKLVYKVKKAVFIGPKSYWLQLQNGEEITKLKTIKKIITRDELLNASKERSFISNTTSNFKIDFKKLQVLQQEKKIDISNTYFKRQKIFDCDSVWKNTKPFKYFFGSFDE